MQQPCEPSDEASFKRSVEQFITLDDKIKSITQEARGLRQSKHALEDAISTHLLDNDAHPHGAIPVKVVTKKKVTNAFTRSNVEDCALHLFGADGAEKLMQQIEELKETTESHCIKRLHTK